MAKKKINSTSAMLADIIVKGIQEKKGKEKRRQVPLDVLAYEVLGAVLLGANYACWRVVGYIHAKVK